MEKKARKSAIYNYCSKIKKIDSTIEVIKDDMTEQDILAKKDEIILLLRSSNLIKYNIGQQLSKLIQPLQHNLYNYRDEKFISVEYRYRWRAKPRIQELICQFQHYHVYYQYDLWTYYQDRKRSSSSGDIAQFFPNIVNTEDVSDNDSNINFDLETDGMDKELPHDLDIYLIPAIFSLKHCKFKTEINGLLYRDNIALYNLIENIFTRMIPSFECLLQLNLMQNDKYKQLSVIVKIEDFQFFHTTTLLDGWRYETGDKYEPIAIGMYYFDISDQDTLQIEANFIEIAEYNTHRSGYTETEIRDINKNDCIIFRNSSSIKHSLYKGSQFNDYKYHSDSEKISQPASIKVISFSILDPNDDNIADQNEKDFKWLNFPWKINAFIMYLLKYDMDIIRNMPQPIISMISVFTFGDEKYQSVPLAKCRDAWDSNVKRDHNSAF